MVEINHKLQTISCFAIMLIAAISTSLFSSVYASGDNHNNNNNNNDKVKVDCNDVAMALATLWLAVGDLDEDGRDTLDDELQEGEIANDVEEIADNFQNVMDKVDDKCDDLDFGTNFIDFEDWNLD